MIAIVAIGFSLGTQYGMGRAIFVIVENELELNEDQMVQGMVHWTYEGTEHTHDLPWPIYCEIRNVQRPELLNLRPGQSSTIRYRVDPLGPLKKDDPFEMYISGVLGIESKFIQGHTILDDRTHVLISGGN
ncbi:MAG: hypothetical protein AAF939_20545 [Planctomycetota bacterium]